VISTSDHPNYGAISDRYGLTVIESGDTDWIVTDQTHPIMNGPFGLVGANGSGFKAAGSIGYFSAGVLSGDTVIASDSLGNPTMLLRQDGDGFILFTSDEGIHVAPSEIYTLNIAVDPINDDPFNSGLLPSDLVALEDTATTVDISNITLTDIDVASGNLTMTIATSGGTLNASNTAGLSVTGNNSGSLSLTGPLGSLNTWIDGGASLSYTGAANLNGNSVDDISFSVSDIGNTGAGGGSFIVLGSIDVDIVSVNDAPSGSDNTVGTLEDNDYTFSAADFGFSDVNDGNGFLAVTIDTLPANGELLLSGVAISAGSSITVADIGLNNLLFRPAAHDNGAGYTSFTFRVQDDDGTANGGSDIDTTARTMTIDVTSVNDAPSGANNTVTTLEDTDYVFAVSDFGFTDINDGDDLFAVRIDTVPGNGQLLLNSIPVSAGASVPVSDITSGDLIFRPEVEDNGAGYTLFAFRVQDDDGTLNGGNDIDATVRIMTIDVTSVNDAPTGADNTVTTLEDTDYVFTVADFGFSDVNDADAFIAVNSVHYC